MTLFLKYRMKINRNRKSNMDNNKINNQCKYKQSTASNLTLTYPNLSRAHATQSTPKTVNAKTNK